MKHFSDTDWADFARDVVSAEAKASMQQHLDTGCEDCAAALRIWRNVTAITGQEKRFTPGEDSVRIVKSFVSPLTKAKTGFRLISDSDLQPLAAGIRGSVSARQVLYETDDYYVDLRLEPRRETGKTSLVGQVLARAKTQGTKGLSVRMHQGKQPVAQTVLNQFGEFQFEFGAGQDLYLVISRDEENEVVLPLRGMQSKSLKDNDLD